MCRPVCLDEFMSQTIQAHPNISIILPQLAQLDPQSMDRLNSVVEAVIFEASAALLLATRSKWICQRLHTLVGRPKIHVYKRRVEWCVFGCYFPRCSRFCRWNIFVVDFLGMQLVHTCTVICSKVCHCFSSGFYVEHDPQCWWFGQPQVARKRTEDSQGRCWNLYLKWK